MLTRTGIWTPASLVLGLSLLFPNTAEAYLDPGTGSLVLQTLIAAFLGLYVAMKMYWNRGTHVVRSLLWKRRGSTPNRGDAV